MTSFSELTISLASIKIEMKPTAFLIVFIFLSASVAAQPADAFFHNSSNAYIDGQFDVAKRTVQEGLLRYPNDPKLQALLEQLEKEQQKQQQNQNQQQQNQDQQQQQNQQQQNQQQNQDQQQQQQQQQSQSDSSGEPQNQQQAAAQMSKAEAEKILKALEQKERDLLKQFKKKSTKPSQAKNEKDW